MLAFWAFECTIVVTTTMMKQWLRVILLVGGIGGAVQAFDFGPPPPPGISRFASITTTSSASTANPTTNSAPPADPYAPIRIHLMSVPNAVSIEYTGRLEASTNLRDWFVIADSDCCGQMVVYDRRTNGGPVFYRIAR